MKLQISNPEPTYCIVNSNNILRTCHKACNIKFGDCDYSLCSKCESIDTGNINTKNGRKTSKRHRLIQLIDNDNTMCCYDINSLVPFMDKGFFTSKYKDTIEANQYVLPMNCSEYDAVLVDKKPTVAVDVKKNFLQKFRLRYAVILWHFIYMKLKLKICFYVIISYAL